MTKRERSLLIVACYGHFMSHFNMMVFPAVLLPLSARLGLEMADTLGLSFLMYLLFGLSALPWGFLADRFGPRKLLSVFHLGAAVCAFGAAMCIDRPALFSFALAGTGLFSGIYHPAGLGWIARETEKTSTAMAINGMFGNLGLAAAPFIAGIINYFYSIDTLYIVVSGMNLLGLVFLLPGRAGVTGGGGKKHSVPVKVNSFSSWTPFYILLVAMMLGGIVYRGTSVTLPSYFELKNGGLFDFLTRLTGGMGSANVTATLFTSIIYIGGMAGQFFGGMVGEKYDLRGSYFLFHAITIPAAIGMALTANIPLIFFAILHGFFLLGMQPIENTLVARLTPPKLISSAYGMKFILTFGVGALSVKIIKMIKLHWGIECVFYALAAVSLLICLVIVFLWRKTSEREL
ncbi:MFS transporter [Desulfomarina profundi]|uniref:MFS transporter n=1 Tax=Desulfomarina profundi TaxID=2772557 RepID=A0A8D5JLV5_9BACT|nr:MFS transporter [Desulfomarina profundi]BCL60937.1 MFS transporter [Desulfomarina profundi]